jgi:hypothetical protein
MPPVGFKPTISAGERPKTYALDRAATGTDSTYYSGKVKIISVHAIIACGVVDIYLHSFLAVGLDRGIWSVSQTSRFTPEKIGPVTKWVDLARGLIANQGLNRCTRVPPCW